MLEQISAGVDIQLTNLVATSSLFFSVDLLHSSHALSRHAVFFRDIALLLYSILCVAIEKNTIVTFFLSILLRHLSQHTKLYRDIDCCNCLFSLLSYWIFLLFELKPTKHKMVNNP